MKKLFNLNSRLKWGVQNPKYTEYTYYFLIRIYNNFCFISDCWNSFHYKLKKLINKQIIIFYSPSNTLCSSDESLQIKYFKHHTLIGMCSIFTWFNLQIQVFYSFSINSQSKLKKSAHYSWEIYRGKLTMKSHKVSWWALWVEDPKNFCNSFFVKSYYLDLKFFQIPTPI